jgi:hypothetical protein
MFRQFGLAAAMLAATLSVPVAADAQSWDGQSAHYQQIDRRYYPGADSRRGRSYGERGYYDRRGYSDGGGRRRGRCDRGTGGTIIGAIAGGLLGNSVAGRGDRGVGTIVGAGVGALAGRAIDRDC